MRLLVVAESPPTTDPQHGNGSTMISAEVLSRLPDDVELDLVYFRDRPADPDQRVLDRARSVVALPLRPGWQGWASLPLASVPRATWLRAAPEDRLRARADGADVVYLHGLHVAPLGRRLRPPVVVNEVDPWSEHWRERAQRSGRLGGAYDRLQARRAEALEQDIARWAACSVVVNTADAARLAARTGGHVVAISNGISGDLVEPSDGSRQVAFVGTLDYPPNIEAVHRLVDEVWPRVQGRVPDARLVLAGRRPTQEVLALGRSGVDVLGGVDDVGTVFGASAAAAYVGVTGRGTKNTVAEAVSAGCPVVASPESARGHRLGEHLLIGDGPDELADLLVQLLTDPRRQAAARASAARAAEEAGGWDDASRQYVELLRRCARRA
jgi:glycosyltransferase involved in cell wall biosynthesis